MALAMLSTIDNPYNPFTQFDDWYAFDTRKKYYTLSFLARVAVVSHNTSEADQMLSIQNAIDEIVTDNVQGNYIKVFEPNSE